MPIYILSGVLMVSLAAPALAVGQDATTYQGQWNNRRYGTSGSMQCTAGPVEESTWRARFDGVFEKREFSYTITFAAKEQGNRTLFQGTSKIDGDEYRWQGVLSEGVIYGRYRSASGNNGEFKLNEARSR